MRQIRKTGAFALCLLLSALCLAVGALAAEEPDYSTLTEENGVYRNNQGIVFTLRTDGSNTAWVGIADGDKVRNNSRYSSESENYNGGVVHIPDTVHIEGSTQNYTVTTIARGAFRYNSELTKIEIGSSVTTIYPRAFCYCPNFTEFSFYEANNTYCTVDGILFDSDKVTLWSVPGGKPLDRYVVPAGTVEIGDDAFFGCVNIKEVVIGGSVRTVCDRAFYDAVGLERVFINSGVTAIGAQVFENYYPKNHPITRYNDSSSLKTLYVYDGVNAIGADLLVNCKSIQTLRLPYLGSSRSTGSYLSALFVTGDGNKANGSSENPGGDYIPATLKEVTIAGGVLRDEAFRKCGNIEKITLGRSITNIPYRCFSMCTALRQLDMGLSASLPARADGVNRAERGIVNILPHVETIGDRAFYGCALIAEFAVDEANENYASDYWGVLYDKEFKKLMCYPPAADRDFYCVAYSAEKVLAWSFSNYCYYLKTVHIPNRSTELEDNAIDDSLGVYRWVHNGSKALPVGNATSKFRVFENYTPQSLTIYSLADNLAAETGKDPAFENLYIIAQYPGSPVLLDPLDYDLSYTDPATGKAADLTKPGAVTVTATYKQKGADGKALSVKFNIQLFAGQKDWKAQEISLESGLAAELAKLKLKEPHFLTAFYNADGRMLYACPGALIDNAEAWNSLRYAVYLPAELVKLVNAETGAVSTTGTVKTVKTFVLDGALPQCAPGVGSVLPPFGDLLSQ